MAFMAAIKVSRSFLLSVSVAKADGEECRLAGGECRGTCLSDEEDKGAWDCSQGGQNLQICCFVELPQKACGEACVDSDQCPASCPACSESAPGQGKVCRVASGGISPPGPIDFQAIMRQAMPDFKFKTGTIGEIISSLLRYIFVLAGIILFIFLIISGFGLLTSGGDPKKVEAAKGQLTSAVAGFLIIFVAYWLIQILEIVFGVAILG